MSQRDPIEHLLSDYADAVRAKDLAAFLAPCSPAIVVFDAWDRWEYRGRDAWRRVIEAWFGSLGPESVRVAVKELATWVDGSVAGGHAVLEFAAYDADGRRLRSLENRLTLVARASGDTWEIVHLHTSIPVAFPTPPAAPRTRAQ